MHIKVVLLVVQNYIPSFVGWFLWPFFLRRIITILLGEETV